VTSGVFILIDTLPALRKREGRLDAGILEKKYEKEEE
jgi:hypothetical protein